MKKLITIVLGLCLACAALVAPAQGMKPGGMDPSAAVDSMDKKIGLNLTAKQKPQVLALVKTVQGKAQAMMAKYQTQGKSGAKLDMATIQKESMGLKSEMYDGMKKILTPAQFKKFKDFSDKQEAEMKARISQMRPGAAKKP